jgi:feruloyl esterase
MNPATLAGFMGFGLVVGFTAGLVGIGGGVLIGAGDQGGNSGGMHALRGPLLGNPAFDLSRFTAQDVSTVRSSWLAGAYEANQPDISAFAGRGGKLILWHGFNDPGPSARGTVEYYEAVSKATTGAQGSVRLFLAPGVAHCSGGAGPDRVDWLAALDNWVDKGVAPQEVPASKVNSTLAWNLCAYPKLPTGQAGGVYACN